VSAPGDAPVSSAFQDASSGTQTEAQPYTGGAFSDSSQGSIDTSQQIPKMPHVPGASGDGSANLSVDTTALKTFADNLDTIADALGRARTRLDQLQPVRAGGSEFVEAQNLASKITGNNGGEGLQENFVTSLTALRTALMDSAEGIRKIAGNYSTIEEINQKAGSDLNQLLQQAQGDLQKLQAATGGSATTASTSAVSATTTPPAETTTGSTGQGSSGATTTTT
jgi:hypothetical protein